MIFSPKARTDAIFYDKIIHFDLTYIVLAAEGGRKGHPTCLLKEFRPHFI